MRQRLTVPELEILDDEVLFSRLRRKRWCILSEQGRGVRRDEEHKAEQVCELLDRDHDQPIILSASCQAVPRDMVWSHSGINRLSNADAPANTTFIPLL